MGMNLTYLILKVLIFWVQFMIGIFLTPKPCRGRAPSILISLFFEKIRKFQILCDSLEFLKILLFLTPFSLKDPTLTPPFKGTTTLFRNMRFVLDEKFPRNASKFAILDGCTIFTEGHIYNVQGHTKGQEGNF